jgi:hypothetical protein
METLKRFVRDESGARFDSGDRIKHPGASAGRGPLSHRCAWPTGVLDRSSLMFWSSPRYVSPIRSVTNYGDWGWRHPMGVMLCRRSTLNSLR